MRTGVALASIFLVAAVGLLSPPASRRSHAAPPAATAKGDLVQAAINVGTLTRFLAALRAADQVGLLRGPGPFTVFAPDDEAWDKLPDGTLEDLLRPENKDRLTALLLYHVAPGTGGNVTETGGKVLTANGGNLELKKGADGVLTVNDARVLRPDLPASNGTLHVIDKVLLPPAL